MFGLVTSYRTVALKYTNNVQCIAVKNDFVRISIFENHCLSDRHTSDNVKCLLSRLMQQVSTGSQLTKIQPISSMSSAVSDVGLTSIRCWYSVLCTLLTSFWRVHKSLVLSFEHVYIDSILNTKHTNTCTYHWSRKLHNPNYNLKRVTMISICQN